MIVTLYYYTKINKISIDELVKQKEEREKLGIDLSVSVIPVPDTFDGIFDLYNLVKENENENVEIQGINYIILNTEHPEFTAIMKRTSEQEDFIGWVKKEDIENGKVKFLE